MSEKKKMPHILHLVIFLAVLGIICAGLLAFVNAITKDKIAENVQKEINESLSALNVSDPIEQKEINKIDGINKVYKGKVGEEDCYVFEVKSKNSYTTITTLVVISAETKLILGIKPVSGTPSFSTHGKDASIKDNDYNVKGHGENDFSEFFNSVSGATVSSSSIKNSIELAYKQLNDILKGVEE